VTQRLTQNPHDHDHPKDRRDEQRKTDAVAAMLQTNGGSGDDHILAGTGNDTLRAGQATTVCRAMQGTILWTAA
jgi:hypothetical protein